MFRRRGRRARPTGGTLEISSFGLGDPEMNVSIGHVNTPARVIET
jgi:hypothetical protein